MPQVNRLLAIVTEFARRHPEMRPEQLALETGASLPLCRRARRALDLRSPKPGAGSTPDAAALRAKRDKLILELHRNDAKLTPMELAARCQCSVPTVRRVIREQR